LLKTRTFTNDPKFICMYGMNAPFGNDLLG